MSNKINSQKSNIFKLRHKILFEGRKTNFTVKQRQSLEKNQTNYKIKNTKTIILYRDEIN